MEAVLSNLSLGLQTAFQLQNLYFCFIGVFLGTLLGVIPGIGTLVSMSLLFPFTFHLEPAAGLIMLAGIYYGTTYGGSTASILMNVPGTPSAAVTCLDGYPMAKAGRAGVALSMTAVASFVGGSVGILIMSLFSPAISAAALLFGPPEYFALIVLGLIASSTANESPAKGLASMTLGMVFGLVGMDVTNGVSRFAFGMIELFDGIALVAVAMGLFGMSEVIWTLSSNDKSAPVRHDVSFRALVPTPAELAATIKASLRGASLGSFFGALPGTGGTIASFMAYVFEKKISRTPEKFGTGIVNGVAAPEGANNAADQTAFIPTLTLGIPGSASMALILGVLVVHGISPGPMLIEGRPEVFWGLIMSFWIGNLMLLVLNIPMVGLWVRLLQVPYRLMFPAIVMFVCVGMYSIERSATDVMFIAVFAAIGVGMKYFDFPIAPLLLGFVLGPMLEENFRRSLVLAVGDFRTFVASPLSALVLLASLLILVSTLVAARRRKTRTRKGLT